MNRLRNLFLIVLGLGADVISVTSGTVGVTGNVAAEQHRPFTLKSVSNNCPISVELPQGQYRGNLRKQRVRRDYTGSFLREDDIVRSAW